jgi:hypothetical protein
MKKLTQRSINQSIVLASLITVVSMLASTAFVFTNTIAIDQIKYMIMPLVIAGSLLVYTKSILNQNKVKTLAAIVVVSILFLIFVPSLFESRFLNTIENITTTEVSQGVGVVIGLYSICVAIFINNIAKKFVS